MKRENFCYSLAKRKVEASFSGNCIISVCVEQTCGRQAMDGDTSTSPTPLIVLDSKRYEFLSSCRRRKQVWDTVVLLTIRKSWESYLLWQSGITKIPSSTPYTSQHWG